MRLALAMVLALTLAGCATSAYRPPPGVVWAYTNDSAAYPHMRTVGYSESKERCESGRAKDAEGMAKTHAWLLATVSAACHQAVVVPGTDYWAFAMPPWYAAGHAAATLVLCDMIRQNQASAIPTACAQISIRFLEPDFGARGFGEAEPVGAPRTGGSSVWGYTAISESMSTFSMVAYSPSKLDCEATRARDSYNTERDNPWLKAAFTECRQAIVEPGADYWVFGVTGKRMSVGATTHELCERLRDEAGKQPPGGASACAPVSVRFLEALPSDLGTRGTPELGKPVITDPVKCPGTSVWNGVGCVSPAR